MAPSWVSSGDEKTIRQLDVIIGYRNKIFTQRLDITHYSRTHAQSGIGVNIIGLQKTLHQFIDQVILFRQALSRYIKRHRIGSVLLNNGSKYRCRTVQCGLPGHPLERIPFGPPHLRIEQAVGLIFHYVMEVHPFGTKHALIDGMVRITFYHQLPSPVAVDDNAAAHATVGAGGFKLFWLRRQLAHTDAVSFSSTSG